MPTTLQPRSGDRTQPTACLEPVEGRKPWCAAKKKASPERAKENRWHRCGHHI